MPITIDGTNGISDVRSTTDGSASTPAIRGTDTNTGIFFPAADTIAFAEGGAEVARFNSSGNLGIGTSSPAVKLHVSGGQSYVTGASGAGAYSRWYNNAQTSNDFQVGQGWSSASDNIAVLNNNANAAMVFGTNGTERMRISSDGFLQFNSGYGSVATAYGCRAWVNFNGTGTVAIRSSGNVSSITDNGTGDYTVNFTTAMPDANYCVAIAPSVTLGSYTGLGLPAQPYVFNTTSVRVITASTDCAAVSVAIFR